MTLYRATPKMISRIMSGRFPARAFHASIANEGAVPGAPGVTAHIAGFEFRDLIDPVTLSFAMPALTTPPGESVSDGFTNQPTVRCEIQSASCIHPLGGASAPIRGQIFMNRYFEADFPVGTYGGWINYLVSNGWFATAGSLTNPNVPAALNGSLVWRTQPEPGV